MKENIVHYSALVEPHLDKVDLIGGEHASFSKHFSLANIGVHYFKIHPGLRTSLPHAESKEEEFVYVISGKIDLWLNGSIKTMGPGDCYGFPAGTGVGHTFINNSDQDCELFVAGERTKKDNQCHFHLAPELKEKLGDFWWDNMPAQRLGGHDGKPGKVDPKFIDSTIETFKGFDHITDESYSYPGDTETFGHGVCLSRKFGMEKIAIWLEKLPPGKRSSWPHAHSKEEEFIFMLSGNASVFMNGELFDALPGQAVDFKAGSGIAHTILNNSSEDVFYLCVGECEPHEDLIYYPFHPSRNQEVKQKGGLWEDCPFKEVPGPELSTCKQL